MNEQHDKRERVVRRACELMGWDYRQSPVWAGIRKVALAEAVVISIEKLHELLDAVEQSGRKSNVHQRD